jgi:hypothetical protein
MAGIGQGIVAALKIVGSLLGICEKRQADNNSPEMKKRAQAQDENKAQDATAEAVAKRDMERLRREASE